MVATSTSIPTCRTDGLGVKGGCLSESILVLETKCPQVLSLSLSLSSWRSRVDKTKTTQFN